MFQVQISIHDLYGGVDQHLQGTGSGTHWGGESQGLKSCSGGTSDAAGGGRHFGSVGSEPMLDGFISLVN